MPRFSCVPRVLQPWCSKLGASHIMLDTPRNCCRNHTTMPDIFGITCIFSSLATSCPVWKISTHYAGRLPTLMRRTRADAPNPCWCTDANLLHRQTGFLQDCAELWIQLLQIYCVCIRKNILLTLMATRKISLNFFDQLGIICWHFSATWKILLTF